MSITPATASGNGISFSPTLYTVQNQPENKGGAIKPLTNEIDDAVSYSISGEAINLAELAANAPEGFKLQKISQASIKQVEFSIKLLQAAKTQRLAGKSTGSDLEDLANAYDMVQASLNENSENSQRHAKFLDDAFSDLSRFFFTQKAEQQYRDNTDFTDDTNNPNLNESAAVRLKQMIAESEKQASIFADAFLKNYKKHGVGAFNIAMSLL